LLLVGLIFLLRPGLNSEPPTSYPLA